MRRWLMLKAFAWMTAKFAQGDCELVLKVMGDDIRFVFPGTSSFAADIRGKAGVERWLRRFVAMHPCYEILDVMVSGPPWNTRIGVRMRDRIGDDYSNEGMHYLRMRWGRICYDRVFIDTEAVSAFEQRHPELAAVS
jgi:ketosteroid isomerase-like protein